MSQPEGINNAHHYSVRLPNIDSVKCEFTVRGTRFVFSFPDPEKVMSQGLLTVHGRKLDENDFHAAREMERYSSIASPLFIVRDKLDAARIRFADAEGLRVISPTQALECEKHGYINVSEALRQLELAKARIGTDTSESQ